MESNQNVLNNELTVDQVAAAHLKSAAMWARFFGVLGFLGAVLFLLFAVFSRQIMEEYGRMYGSGFELNSQGQMVFSITYGVIALITFIIALYQFNFGVKAKRAVASMDARLLGSAFQSLKVYYTIMGIITILGILLFILGIVGMAMR